MIRGLSIAALIAIGATAVHAQSAAISQRQEAMKAIASAAKEPGAVLKGEAKFDLAKIHSTLELYQAQANKLKELWPEESKSGDTAALPAIWERRNDFIARFDKLAADAKFAAEKITDEASFKAEWPKVMSNCSGCHREYRKPR